MGFLAPWFLAGLAALGLPLWIHLLRQHRTVPRPFSSLMFFERRTQSSVKHRRLKYKALLLLRLLLLLLLALAFASPYLLRSVAGAERKRTVVIAVDRSFSMRYGDVFEQAKRDALAQLGKVPQATPVQAVALSGGVEVLSQPAPDAAEARAAIAGLRISDGRAPYGEFARYLRTLSESTKLPVEAHLFTDAQKTAMPAGFADLRLPSDATFELHSSGTAERPNYYVESVAAPKRIYDPKRVRIQATITASAAPKAVREVRLSLNGKVVQSKQAEVPERGRAVVEFAGLDAPYGWSKGEISIDSGDKLAADDRFLFSIERTDPRKVLFLHSPRDTRSPLYFRTALESSSEGAFQMEARTTDQAEGIALQNYAMAVLSDAAFLSPSAEKAIARWVSGGGSVLVTLGPASSALAKAPVSGEALSGSRYAARSGERFFAAAQVDQAHPATQKLGQMEGVKFYQAVAVEPGSARVIARLSDQGPLLLEKTLGEGRIMLLATTFDNVANDFPLHPGFVPFIEQISRYLSRMDSAVSNVAVDSFIELRRDSGSQGTAEVIDPDGKRILSLEQASKAAGFPVDREGFFDVRRADGRRETVAVHADRRESDLTPVAQETLALWQNAAGQSSAAAAADSTTRPWSPWWYLLLLLAVISAGEFFLANRYLSTDIEASEASPQKEAA